MLEDEGFVRFPGAFQESDAKVLLGSLWQDYAERHGVVYGEPSTWLAKKPRELRLYGKPPHSLKGTIEYILLESHLNDIADHMFGEGVYRSVGKTSLFVNCPARDGKWSTPSGWHADIDISPSDSEGPRPDFFYAFAFLDVLEPHGGATVLLTRSARRARASGQIFTQQGKLFIEALANENADFKALFRSPGPEVAGGCAQDSSDECERRFKDDGVESGGCLLKLVELTGSPGDITIWDPCSLHSASSNFSDRPRSVIRFRLERMVKPR